LSVLCAGAGISSLLDPSKRAPAVQGRGLTPPSVFLQRVNAEFAVDAYGMGYLDPSKDPSTEPDVSHTASKLPRRDTRQRTPQCPVLTLHTAPTAAVLIRRGAAAHDQ